MKLALAIGLAAAVAPALAIPPPDFGFPEAPNDTALEVAFRQDSGSVGYVPITEAELLGYNITARPPALGVNTTAYRSLANFSGEYVVLMVDPDDPTPNHPTSRFVLHWLQPNMVQSANAPVNRNLTLSGRKLTNSSAPLVPWLRPSPSATSDAHRYIIYAFAQPANFSLPRAYAGYGASNRSDFNLSSFVRDADLGVPAAANYFYVDSMSSVPGNFTAPPAATYPGGDGFAVTTGDPYGSSATAASAASSSSSHASGSGSSSSGTSESPAATGSSSAASGSAAATSTKAGAAAMITGAGSLLGAGLVGLAALL